MILNLSEGSQKYHSIQYINIITIKNTSLQLYGCNFTIVNSNYSEVVIYARNEEIIDWRSTIILSMQHNLFRIISLLQYFLMASCMWHSQEQDQRQQ